MYAHTLVEIDGKKYSRGDEIPKGSDSDLFELEESGAINTDPPVNDPADPLYDQVLHGPPDNTVEITSGDSADTGESTG